MKIREIKCKTALSTSLLPGLDYSLNPYKGCQHKCVYCYVPNVIRIERQRWGSYVNIKINIPIVLSRELKKKEPGVVGISTVTDPYQPVEKKYHLSRYCLEQLLKYDFPICIQTKSSLVVRDADIISKFSDAEVMMSVGTLNKEERQLLEPNSSSLIRRLEALKEYSTRGVKTSIFFGPVYPTILVEDIPMIIDTFIDYGVEEIIIDRFNLKPGIWENIEKTLSPHSNLKNIFRKNWLENHTNYQKVLEEFIRLCKRKNVKTMFAF